MKTTGRTTGKNQIKIMEIINMQRTKTIIMMALRSGKNRGKLKDRQIKFKRHMRAEQLWRVFSYINYCLLL